MWPSTRRVSAKRLQHSRPVSASWQHAPLTAHGWEEEASDCNIIRPLGPAAARLDIKPVRAGESRCMDPGQTCQLLYTATTLGVLAPDYFSLIGVLPIVWQWCMKKSIKSRLCWSCCGFSQDYKGSLPGSESKPPRSSSLPDEPSSYYWIWRSDRGLASALFGLWAPEMDTSPADP